ncbi:MAG: type II toxin-antitoxin system RelB/DinJ family antitoxin [Atopobiaceae bacterium]|nr:type II toxin-antitoxin system RelB/DinJ family antitoxin [Atopobiaceae bacterium]
MKDATVSARVEYSIKNEAEEILRQIGVPVSVVINSLYRQIIFQGGIPFPLTLPSSPRTLDGMAPEEVDAMLSSSYAQSLTGKGKPFGEAFDELEAGLS